MSRVHPKVQMSAEGEKREMRRERGEKRKEKTKLAVCEDELASSRPIGTGRSSKRFEDGKFCQRSTSIIARAFRTNSVFIVGVFILDTA